MPSKAKMTIRFDPPQARIAPKPPAPPAAVETAPTDVAALEQLIRQAEPARSGQAPSPTADTKPSKDMSIPDHKRMDPAPARAEDKLSEAALADDAPEWSAGPLIEIANDGLRMRQAGPSWWKVILSAASAVATGALFGFLVLSLFSSPTPDYASNRAGEPASQTAMSQHSAPYAEANPLDPQDAAFADPMQEASHGQAVQSWPETTWYWLQYGVFRSREAMDAAAAELADAGLPGFGDQAEGFRVYAGVAATKEMAGKLASQMPGRELYIKPIIMPEANPAMKAGGEEWRAFVALSEQLAASLSRLSVDALQDEQPQPVDEAKRKELREMYKEWQRSAADVEEMQGALYTEGSAMVQALSDAFSSFEQYEGNVSRYHLWRIQEHLMKMLAAERRLRDAAVVQSF